MNVETGTLAANALGATLRKDVLKRQKGELKQAVASDPRRAESQNNRTLPGRFLSCQP